MSRPAPVIAVESVCLHRNGQAILQDVSWTVPRRRHCAIVGPNGSGKTTLLRIATGYLWPTSGTVAVLGHRFGQVDLRELRKQIGWVSSALEQRMPPGLSVRDAVVSGRYGSIGLFDEPTEKHFARADALLDDVGLAAIAGRKFGVLSLGERQRVLIARALMPDPPLLILDEPCAGLDLRAREHLLDEIDQLARSPGRTMVLVTHHVEEITPVFADALVLRAGRVHACGPKEEVLTGEVLRTAFDIDIRVSAANGRFWARIGPED